MRTLHPFFVVPFIAAVFLACGGSAVVPAKGQGTGGQGTGGQGTGGQSVRDAGPPTGDGGCIEPTEGQPCTVGDLACQPADPCCAGYEWMCSQGAWQKAGLGCACANPGLFACGPTTCTGAQYCEDRPRGVAPDDGGTPSDSFDCQPLPPSCGGFATCACIQATLSDGDPCSTKQPGITCEDDGAGHVILRCMGI